MLLFKVECDSCCASYAAEAVTASGPEACEVCGAPPADVFGIDPQFPADAEYADMSRVEAEVISAVRRVFGRVTVEPALRRHQPN